MSAAAPSGFPFPRDGASWCFWSAPQGRLAERDMASSTPPPGSEAMVKLGPKLAPVVLFSPKKRVIHGVFGCVTHGEEETRGCRDAARSKRGIECRDPRGSERALSGQTTMEKREARVASRSWRSCRPRKSKKKIKKRGRRWSRNNVPQGRNVGGEIFPLQANPGERFARRWGAALNREGGPGPGRQQARAGVPRQLVPIKLPRCQD